MGEIFFLFLAFLLLVKIITEVDAKKLPWFFVGILFFPHTVALLTNPSMPFPRLVIYGLLIAFLFQNRNTKQSLKSFPLSFPLLLLFLCLLSIGMFDPRINFFLKIYRPTCYFLENFFIVFLTYFYVKSIEDAKRIYNFIVVCFLVFALYGIINYITGISLYNSIIAETYNNVDFGNRYTIIGDARFRIASFAWHPIYYGLLLGLVILLMIFLNYEKRLQIYSKITYNLIFLLLALNLVWTNSRTPMLALIGGIGVFYVFGIGFWNKLRIALVGVVLGAGILTVSPDSLKIVNDSINTLTSQGSEVEGSSLEMRDVQMAASLLIFSQNPVFGNGFGYIVEDLGHSSDEKKRTSDADLFGFESYSYELLIEQGLLGILGNLFFFISLFWFFSKMRKRVDPFGQRLIYLSLGMTFTFLLFIFGTGDLDGFMFFMSLLGVNIKTIMLSLKENPDLLKA